LKGRGKKGGWWTVFGKEHEEQRENKKIFSLNRSNLTILQICHLLEDIIKLMKPFEQSNIKA
jgi:hypothetical protein